MAIEASSRRTAAPQLFSRSLPDLMQSSSTAISTPQPLVENRSARPVRVSYPLTLRGTLIAMTLGYVLAGPVHFQADIIAATLGYSAISLFFLLLVGTLVQGARFRKMILLEINHGVGIERFESGKLTTLVLKLPRFSVFPGFVLIIKPQFASDAVTLPEFRLTGSAQAARFLTYPIVFPHRGIWNIKEVKVSFGDQLGITQLHWRLFGESIQRRFTVFPPHQECPLLPVISSCERPGDLLTHTQERHGDPFDIRQYHPSDGSRRIVWKVFARRGELVSRHPEASMTPEGQVAIFAPAILTEDYLCNAVTKYAQQLRDLDLELFCGCAGMEGAAARTPEQVQSLLVDSVWRSDTDAGETAVGLSRFLDLLALSLKNDRLRRIIIFTSPERFRSERDSELMSNLGELISKRGVEPVFFMVNRNGFNPDFTLHQLKTTTVRRRLELVTGWFFEQPAATTPVALTAYQNFLRICAKQSWEVMMTKS